MNVIIEFLKQPLVGSLIGILGIIIGAILAVAFYLKAKVVAKPEYSIANSQLINLNNGAIPDNVYMVYDGNKIKNLTKTTIRIWNAGKKTINKSDLEPAYLSIPFVGNHPNLTHFININTKVNHSHISVSTPIVTDTLDIHFDFNFLDYKDSIEIEILHTAKNPPKEIKGYIKGVPKGLINVSDRQETVAQILTPMVVGNTELFSRVLLRIIQAIYK